MTVSTDKQKALESAMSQVERQFGKGSIMKLGSRPIVSVPVISTSSLALDKALGIGGLPRGRVVEIFGPEASGKTTLALHAVAEAQKQDGIAAFIDAEHALDTVYAKKLGVNCDELLVSQPDTGEQALEIADMLVRSGAIDVLVVDSVAALVPRAEIEGEMGDAHMGLQARLMSQALRKLTGTISKTNTCVIFINQMRMKIGVVFGNPETTTGGNALKFYASVRLDIRRTNTLKEGQDIIGSRTRVRVVKNKLAPPFMEAEFDVIYGEGISRIGDLIDAAAEQGIIEKSGAWYSFGGERIVGAHLRNGDRTFLDRLARSKSLWERRIAILSTFHFIRRGELADTLRIAGMLVGDREDLIHKAVGWLLREVGKRDLAAEEAFLREHCRTMPRTMLRYAIEKFPEEKRQRYLKGTV